MIAPNPSASSGPDRELVPRGASNQGMVPGQAGIGAAVSSGPPDVSTSRTSCLFLSPNLLEGWKSFTSDTFGKYAKPIWTPPGSLPTLDPHMELPSADQTQVVSATLAAHAPGDNHGRVSIVGSSETLLTSQHLVRNNRPELGEPLATKAGRSGFSTAPSPSQLIEVHIPVMDARTRAEYDRVSDISGAFSHAKYAETASSASATSKRSRGSKKQIASVARFPTTLNLERFAYKNDNPIAHRVSAVSAKRGQTRRRKASATVKKTARSRIASKRSQAQMVREEKMRIRSLFLRAAGHHQRC